MEKGERSKVFHRELLQCWETCDDHQGGIVETVNQKAIRIRTYADMNCGKEMKIRLFSSLGYDFTECQLSAKVVEKGVYCQEGWELYEYQLEFINMSEEDGLNLRELITMGQTQNIYS